MLPLTKPLSDCQLSMGLALSLGHQLDDIHITKKQRCMVMVWNSARTFKYYREFDYRDWRIAGPVATLKTLFPKPCRGRWILWLDGANSVEGDTPQKTIALAALAWGKE